MTSLKKLQKLQINTSKVEARSGLCVNKLWRVTSYLVVGLFVLTILSLLPEIALAAKVGIDRLDGDGYCMKLAFISGAAFFVIGGGDLRERAARLIIPIIAVSVLGKLIAGYDEWLTKYSIQKGKIEWHEKRGKLKEGPAPEVSES